MVLIEFSELPEDLRVKLSEQTEEELWHRIDEFGGVKEFTNHFEYSASKMYNWKNKKSFLPLNFVKRLMGGNNTKGIKALKGKGRSKAVKDLNFPLEVSEELLTRVDSSVTVNAEGIPTYTSNEKSLAERFAQLLLGLGDVPNKSYSRQGRFEIRYPKFLQEIFELQEFEKDFSALVDEQGKIEDGKVKASGKEVAVEEFSGKLYSRQKKFDLVLQRGDKEALSQIIGGEASKVQSLVEK